MRFLRMPAAGKEPVQGWVAVPRLNVTWGFPKIETARAVASPKLWCGYKLNIGQFGFWRPSRRRALVETLRRADWAQCILSRAVNDCTIFAQFSVAAFNIPILADAMGLSEDELWVVLARMDGFRINRLIPSRPYIEFNFPADWAPDAFGNTRPNCPVCHNTGAEDWSHLAIDMCDCRRAVWTLIGPDWPDAPHPLLPPDASPSDAPAHRPTGRTQGNPTPAPDKSGPGQPGKDAA